MQPLLDGRKASGINVAIHLPDGQETFLGYGRTSETEPKPPGPDTHAAIGSLTKGLVGMLALRLVEDGRIHWDDTITPHAFI